MTLPSYVMQRYPAQTPRGSGAGPIRFELEFERPYPHMRLFYVDHNHAGFDVYWVDVDLLVPEGELPTREDMQAI